MDELLGINDKNEETVMEEALSTASRAMGTLVARRLQQIKVQHVLDAGIARLLGARLALRGHPACPLEASRVVTRQATACALRK